MSTTYKEALRYLQKHSAKDHLSYATDLFPVGWAYAENPDLEHLTQARPAAAEARIAAPDKSEGGVTERTKVLDSFHEFATKRLEESEKGAFAFPGGEASKKTPAASMAFKGRQGKDVGTEELKGLSADISQEFASLKFSLSPKSPLKVLFLADESVDTLTLLDKSMGLEAFFESSAAQLFDRMIGAMKLSEGDYFVSSLNVLKGSESFSFEEQLVCEISTLKPELLVTLGGAATSAVLGAGTRLQSSHGQFFEKEVVTDADGRFLFQVMPLFSPAFLVEAPNTKRIAWEDMQKAMKKLGL